MPVALATPSAMPRSLTIRSRPKPASNLRDSTNCLNFFCVELFMPVETLSTSTISAGSRPKRWPISSASMPIRKPPALTRLLSAFMAWALPMAPVRMIEPPIARSSGSALSIAAASPPAMMASSPVLARDTPPETGASIRAMPCSAALPARIRVASGTPLDISTMREPCASAENAPSGPSSTAATTALEGSMVTRMSQPSAAAAGVSAARAPIAAAMRCVRAASASCTASRKPAAARRAAIGSPMAPSPMKPMRLLPSMPKSSRSVEHLARQPERQFGEAE